MKLGAIGAFLLTGLIAQAPSDASAELGDTMFYGYLLFEQLEVGVNGADNPIAWDVMGWYGADYDRIWIRSEGVLATDSGSGEGEAQLLYSRLVLPFWEVQIGARADLRLADGSGTGRGHLVLGLTGMTPYGFEVEGSTFVSQHADIAFRLRSTQDIYVTQRLIAQSLFEMNVAVQEVEAFDVGAGVNDIQVGLRLRYEIIRKVAPYLGISWRQKIGSTADLARGAGERTSDVSGVVGLRVWM